MIHPKISQNIQLNVLIRQNIVFVRRNVMEIGVSFLQFCVFLFVCFIKRRALSLQSLWEGNCIREIILVSFILYSSRQRGVTCLISKKMKGLCRHRPYFVVSPRVSFVFRIHSFSVSWGRLCPCEGKGGVATGVPQNDEQV